MTDIFSTLAHYFEYPFVTFALIVGVLIALCAALLGVPLVLKRFSFIGDGLSHVAFGALAVATVLHITNTMLLVMPITVVAAVLLLKAGENRKIQGDAMLAMLSVGALAVGYLLMNVFSASTNTAGDVCSTLFGATSILTLTKTDVIICIVLSVVVIGLYLLLYHRIFAVTFDSGFSQATGLHTKAYNTLLSVITAVIIVMAMNLVGSLLISALVVFPALSAMGVLKSFRGVTICAAILSVFCAAVGILISILASTPVGSTIVLMDLAAFLIFRLIGRLQRR